MKRNELRILQNKMGFTLIEVILIIVLVGIFMAVIGMPFVNGIRQSRLPEVVAAAQFVAVEKLEETPGMDYDAVGTGTTTGTASGYQWQRDVNEVDDDLASPGTRHKVITVTVSHPTDLPTGISITTSRSVFLETTGTLQNLDTLEFDTGNGREPSIVHVTGDIYAIAYQGPGNDGFLKTVDIDTDGTINPVIDTLEFDTGNGRFPSIVHVTGDIYAIAYQGPGNDGFLKTVDIDSDGNINPVIDTLEFDTGNGRIPSIVHVTGDIYAIAYQGPGNDGFLKTVDIDSDGTINPVIDTLEFDTGDGRFPSIVHVTGDIYAIAYQGPGNDGFLKTVDIDSDGTINPVIDTLEFDTGDGREPSMVHVSGDIYAITYRGPGNDGFLKTVDIDSDGTINPVIDALEFDTGDGRFPSIIQLAGYRYAIAYQGPGDDGWLKTMDILGDGTINPVIDTLEFETSNGETPDTILVTGDVIAIAYRGQNDDGWLTTVGGAGIALELVAGSWEEL